jgi:ACR3 family arsenite efflux pump ArsB
MNTIQKFSKLNVTALLLAMVVSFAATPAFAAGESASIIPVITEYAAEAVLVIVAFCIAVWGLRGAGMLGRKS